MARPRPKSRGGRPPRRPPRSRHEWDDEDEPDEEIAEEQEIAGLMRLAERTEEHMRNAGNLPDYPLLQTVSLPVPIQSVAALLDKVKFRYPTSLDFDRAQDRALEELAERPGPITEDRVKRAMGPILMSRLSGLKRKAFDTAHPESLTAMSDAIELFTPSSPEDEEQ